MLSTADMSISTGPVRCPQWSTAEPIPLKPGCISTPLIFANWDEGHDIVGGAFAPYSDSEDKIVTPSSGLSWIRLGEKNLSHRFGTIYDGSLNTLMLEENVNAGIAGTGASPAPDNCIFVYPTDISLVKPDEFPGLVTGSRIFVTAQCQS